MVAPKPRAPGADTPTAAPTSGCPRPLSWARLASGTQWPRWGSLPCEPQAELPFGLFEKPLYLRTARFPLPRGPPPTAPPRTSGRNRVINSRAARGLLAFMLLTFRCINSRTMESELFLSIALNITRESGSTIGAGLSGEVEISGLALLGW